MHEVGPQETVYLLVPWSWTSQSLELWEVNVCWLSHPVSAICVKAAWNKTLEEEGEKYVIELATITESVAF